MIGEITFKANFLSGVGKGAFFVNIDWVKEGIRKKFGFLPFPGTLNLKVKKEDFEKLQKIIPKGYVLIPPASSFCVARFLKGKVGEVEGVFVFPEERVWLHRNVLEFIAPYKVKERMELKEGDQVECAVFFKFTPDAVIFDLDGALVDPSEAYEEILKIISQKFKLLPPSKEEIKNLIKGRKDPWSFIFSTLDKEKLEEAKNLDKMLLPQIYPKKTKLLPYAVELIKELKKKGIKLAICTNQLELSNEIHELLEEKGIKDFFDLIIVRRLGEYFDKKEAIKICCEKFGVDILFSVYVTDDKKEAELCKEIGIQCIIVENLEEIAQILWN